MEEFPHIPIHVISVGAGAGEMARTELLIQNYKPLSSRSCLSLEELNGAVFSQDAYTVLRLFGKANSDALRWLGATGQVATDVAVLGFADAILIEPGHPLRGIGVLPEAFVSAIAARKVSFELSRPAFIIGASEEAKVIAAGLSRLGFKRLMIVDSDDGKTEQVVKYLRRRLLGIEIEAVPRRTLTQIPNEAALAISVVEANDTGMLEDISYLNFLRKSGVWIDWNSSTLETGLDKEIIEAGAHIFDPILIRAWREALVLNSIPGLLLKAGQKPEAIASRLGDVWTISQS
jgi:hypothetical protein